MGILKPKPVVSMPATWSSTEASEVSTTTEGMEPVTDALADILTATNSLIALTQSILTEVPLLMLPQVEDGGQTKVWVKDDGSMKLMERWLIELRKTNLYLSSIGDLEVSDRDVEQGG